MKEEHMIIRMKDFGVVLESRELAKRLVESFVDILEKRPDDNIRLDFSGIRVVSGFFADELIGGIVQLLGFEKFEKSVSLTNMSDLNRIWLEKAVEKHGKNK